MRYLLTMLSLIAFFTYAEATAAAEGQPTLRTVRVIYLVSSDREEKAEYKAALDHAIRDLQKWYGKQLGGASFRLSNPVVEVVKSEKPGDWFYSHENGTRKDDWGFNNALAETNRLLRAKFNDPQYIWVIYSDGPGDKGRGGNGVTVLPENDLLGLVGKHPDQKDKSRWIAGLGHEVGHAFGLPHPSDTKKHADAIMWTGIYGKYPDKTYLTPDDKKILMQSPFFYHEDDTPVSQLGKIVTSYAYAGGAFNQHAGKPIQWSETKTDSDESYLFEETRRDGAHAFLLDDSRGFTLKIPLEGGAVLFSSDRGKTYRKLYTVNKPKVR